MTRLPSYGRVRRDVQRLSVVLESGIKDMMDQQTDVNWHQVCNSAIRDYCDPKNESVRLRIKREALERKRAELDDQLAALDKAAKK